MQGKFFLTVLFLCFCFVRSLPTIYKFNENKVLEPDLVPVSSTVIPLPVYQVSSGFNVAPSKNDGKIKKPDGPISLVTIHNTKKATEIGKPKLSDISTVKQLNKKDFDH